MTKSQLKMAILNHREKEAYEELINDLIRERYTINQELAIQRQRDEKPDEFSVYYNYAEWCKEKAKMTINEVKNSL